MNPMLTETARKRGSDQMTVVELDTNRAAANVSDGAGQRDICFLHFASAVASANTAGHTIGPLLLWQTTLNTIRARASLSAAWLRNRAGVELERLVVP